MENNFIYCKHCGEKIRKYAYICPKCGYKNKKPLYKRFWIWCLIVFIIIYFLTGDSSAFINTNIVH